MKKIAILGSTGSIGTQTLDIVRAYAQDLQETALCAGKNTDLMERQIREFRPALAVMWHTAEISRKKYQHWKNKRNPVEKHEDSSAEKQENKAEQG